MCPTLRASVIFIYCYLGTLFCHMRPPTSGSKMIGLCFSSGFFKLVHLTMLDLLEGPGFGVQQKSFQPLHMVYVGPILGGDLSYPLQPLPKQSYCPARVFSCQLALHLRFRRYLLLFGTNYWTFLASVSGPLIFPKKSEMPWKGVKHLSFFQGIYLENIFRSFLASVLGTDFERSWDISILFYFSVLNSPRKWRVP